MYHDATIEVTCDGPLCAKSIRIKPPFRDQGFSGSGTVLATSDATLNFLTEDKGWQDQGSKHYCGSHGTWK